MIESPLMQELKKEWTEDGKREGLREGKREGLAEGKREGRREGEIRALMTFLIRRFGAQADARDRDQGDRRRLAVERTARARRHVPEPCGVSQKVPGVMALVAEQARTGSRRSRHSRRLGVRDVSATEIKLCEIGESVEVQQAGIGHLSIVELKRLELGQGLEMRQPRIGDLGVDEVQVEQVGQSLQIGQPRVGDRSVTEAYDGSAVGSFLAG